MSTRFSTTRIAVSVKKLTTTRMLSERYVKTRIEIVMTDAQQNAYVTFDGQSTFSLQEQDRVYVRRAEHEVELVHPSSRSHFEVLRIKLGWGESH